jgi:stress-induced morphogen
VGSGPIAAAPRAPETADDLLMGFARRIRARWPNARVYLFGSRARGTATDESDYDVVVVTSAFAGRRRLDRPVGLYPLWREAGGWGIGLDLHCYTPDEFRRQTRGGIGYLGEAKRHGELISVRTGRRARPSASPLLAVDVPQSRP